MVLTDALNDGWDGAYMDVSVNGTLIYDDITVASGASPAEFTLALNDGDVVQTAYTPGSWESEHSYAFYDNNGTLVASDGPSPGAGITFTASVSSDVPGCMTAAACNYSADATADDGSCCLTNCTTIAMGGGTFLSETSWDITDAAGNVVASGAGAASSDFSCLDDGDYTATGTDSWGDGWNGNMLTVTDDDGSVYLSWGGPGAELAGGESASVTFSVPLPPPPAVFFSEYAEGSSNNKYLEIYNNTGADFDMGTLSLSSCSNGCDNADEFDYPNNVTFAAGTIVAAGDVFVVGHPSANDAILAESDYTDFVYMSNGDDAFALTLAGATATDYTILDIIGDTGGDPGNGWSVAGVDDATKDNTLRRKDAVAAGNDGDWAASAGTTVDDSEYIVEERPTADYTPATLGWHIIDPSVTYSANFAIDMNGTGYPNDTYPSVVINGSWNGWAGNGVALTDADMDGIYTGTLSGLAEATMIEYVVSVTGESDGWGGWGVTFNAPLDSDCDYVPGDGYGNYGFTIMGADVNLAHIAGSCMSCDANLVSVQMNDAWGDGWNGNVLTIGTDSLTIESGSYAFAELCLEDGSFLVTCDGGSFQGEVSWVMVDAAGDTLLVGGAPYSGVLQLGETTDVLGCTDADAVNYDENATLDDGSCYYAGDSCSISLAAVVGANDASGAEQWFSYTATLDGFITATTCYEGQAEDTDVDVYDACDGNMIASSDDAGCGDITGGNNYASHVEFPVVTGETYYFFWDDTWSPGPFTWMLEEALPSSEPENLTATIGVESVSLEWDGYIPTSNRSLASNNWGTSIEDANAAYLAKVADLKGDEPTEIHTFGVVNSGYVSNSRSTDVIIECDGGSWQSEVSWEILDAAGDTVASGGAPSGQLTASLDDGVYTVNGYDAYGDGWNGNTLTVTGATDGAPWLNFTIDAGDFATTTFTMSDTPPTDLPNLNITNVHYDEATDAAIITVNNTGAMDSEWFYICYYFYNPVSGECENYDYTTWGSFDFGLPADSSYTYVIQSQLSAFLGNGTFEVGAFIDWGCQVAESNEDDNTASATIQVGDPWEGVTWNVYRSDAGAEFASVGVAESVDYTDEGLTGDVEYCYYVTQVDTEGAAESGASNTACATPVAALDLPVPTELTAESDGYDVMVNWMSPDLTGFGTMSYAPATGEKDPGQPYNPADYPDRSRQGGDTFSDAVAIDGLPYENTGTTAGYNHDYGTFDSLAAAQEGLLCAWEGWSGSTGAAADVVYSLALPEEANITISLCGSFYDTSLGVFTVSGTDTILVLGNDDFCDYQSQLSCVLPADTYYIVVSGYATSVGDYVINVTQGSLPSPVMGYNVYRGGEIVGSTDHVDSTSFHEFVAVEGDHAYYMQQQCTMFTVNQIRVILVLLP